MTDIIPVSNTQKLDRTADIVFLHGLGGDAHLTWGARRQGDEYNLDLFWPRWLGEDFPDVGVWSVEYDAAGSKWTGSSMPISDRATNVLELLAVSELGNRPLIFITHNMGGLVVKQMLQTLATNTNVKPDWSGIYDHTRGIAFFSTPHNGSRPASAFRKIWPLRPGTNIAELAANNPQLRTLNQWFRNNIKPSQIHLLVYCEAQSTKGLRVVDETSADPGMEGVTAVPLDFDHKLICKLASKDMRYRGIVKFVRRALEVQAKPSPVRNDESLLDAAESVVARFRELDSKIRVSVSSVTLFKEDWGAEERKKLVGELRELAYSEIAISKARTALCHLEEELRRRRTVPPAKYVAVSDEILLACSKYLRALCPNERVTPFPSAKLLLQFLNQILEAKDPAAVEEVLSLAKTHLGMPERNDLEDAERALGSLRSILSWRQDRRDEKRERRRSLEDDDDNRCG